MILCKHFFTSLSFLDFLHLNFVELTVSLVKSCVSHILKDNHGVSKRRRIYYDNIHTGNLLFFIFYYILYVLFFNEGILCLQSFLRPCHEQTVKQTGRHLQSQLEHMQCFTHRYSTYKCIEYRRPFWLVLTLKINISRTMQ